MEKARLEVQFSAIDTNNILDILRYLMKGK